MSKTLLQLMLESNVVWPIGASFAAQDGGDGKVFFYEESPNRDKGSLIWLVRGGGRVSCVKLKELAIDSVTSSISKSGYQAAGGWMEYDGNGSPVPKGTTVIVVWSDGGTNRFTQDDTPGPWAFRNPVVLRYRILVDGDKAKQPTKAATEQASKEAESTCVILTGSGTIHSDARVLYNSGKTVVWEKDGEEYTATFGYVTINPSREEIASAVLFGLCDETVDPPIMRELMNKMGWK